MRTPEDVFEDFCQRRKAILRALTTDVQKFYAEADPERENLCLYGNSDGSWEVDLPAEEVPPELPEPALGINFARDGMEMKDWLALCAVHSDAWLTGVSFYNAARLNAEGRQRLFELINELPTTYEIVSGRVPREPAKNVGSNNRKRPMAGPGPRGAPQTKQSKPQRQMSGRHRSDDEDDDPEFDDEDEDAVGGGDQYADGEGDPCPNCGRVYRTGEFWIACDFCDTCLFETDGLTGALIRVKGLLTAATAVLT
ncbi:hypothetical protein WJX72_007409 [[Myrmecia] bisecta]|uniref:Alfin N-terminal domain-containing protein n=1 Tax=[Myrmecia] bisecta TaxID=41462 RepID=A0AAW1PHH4_9CHLO